MLWITDGKQVKQRVPGQHSPGAAIPRGHHFQGPVRVRVRVRVRECVTLGMAQPGNAEP